MQSPDVILQRLCNLVRDFAALQTSRASSWLTVLPMQEHGFALYKGAFRDATCLRYGWHPSGLPPICAFSKDFTVEHAMNCPTGGFPTIRHNEQAS